MFVVAVEGSYQFCGRFNPHKLEFLGTGFNGTRTGDTLTSTTTVVVVSLLSSLGHIVRRRVVGEKFCLSGSIWNKLSTLLNRLLLTILIVNYLIVSAHVMSFSVEEFAAAPRLATLASLKKSELMLIATHYKLEIAGGTHKADVRKVIVSYLVDEEIV